MPAPQGLPSNVQQNMAMFSQMAGNPAGGQRPPMLMPQPGQGAPGMQQPNMPPQGPQGLTVQQAAQMGRGGDSLVAHLTPGEIAVPPEVQSPKVLATLNKAFHAKHVDPQQFTAGSPGSSTNPQTGLPEYNFLSSFLPAALGIAGSLAFPMIAPAAMSAATAGAVGSGLGATAGGLIGGQDPLQAILSGAGAGAGGYLLGGLGSGAGETAGAADNAATQAGANAAGGAGNAWGIDQAVNGMTGGLQNVINALARGAANAAGAGASAAAAQTPSAMNMWGMLPHNINPMAAVGSTLGGMAGSYLGAPTPKQGPAYPAGFNDHAPAPNSTGTYDQLLGTNNYTGPQANFTDYNPYTSAPMAYNFFPKIAQ